MDVDILVTEMYRRGMRKTAFSSGGAAAVRLPAQAGIKSGDRIRTTVLARGKVLVERDTELPDYSHVLRKRTRSGGSVTNELVARLLSGTGF